MQQDGLFSIICSVSDQEILKLSPEARESEDEVFGPSTVTEVVRPDVFMLLPNPDDKDSRYVTQFGKIEFEYEYSYECI